MDCGDLLFVFVHKLSDFLDLEERGGSHGHLSLKMESLRDDDSHNIR